MKKLLTILFAVALGLNLSAQYGSLPCDTTNCSLLKYDGNDDGMVNYEDFLEMLGAYGSADVDGDCIEDSQDDCVEDGCGVCDGPGPTVQVVDTIVFIADSTFIEVLNEWYVFEVPDTLFTFWCSYPGCTDPTACNYDPSVTEEDDSCDFPIEDYLGCQGECLNDEDEDGVCDENEIEGCVDPVACNYDAAATDGDYCGYADAGYDCGGNCIEANADGSCAGALASCNDGSTSLTFDGYTYDLVGIGGQCWFAENLRSVHYANGDAIPGGLSDSEWITTTDGAMTVYGEGDSQVIPAGNNCWEPCGVGDEVLNLAQYGRLYNAFAVADSRGLCPNQWHVPSAEEWVFIQDLYGGASTAGEAHKSSSNNSPSWNGTNESGFSGLAGGGRSYSYGYFTFQGQASHFWSTSLQVTFFTHNAQFFMNTGFPREGRSVRCVRD